MLGAIENAGVVQLFNEQGRAIELIANNQGGQIVLSKNGKFPVAVLSADKNARLELRQNGNQRTVCPADAAVRNDPFGS